MKGILRCAALTASFLTLLVACGGPSVRQDVPTGTPEETAPPELTLATAGGLPEMGRRLADLLRARYPDTQWGRLVLAWDSRSTWLSPLGRGFSANWRSCVLATDLGLSAARAEDVFIQLDPSYFRGLLWLQPLLDSSGRLASLRAELKTIGPGPVLEACIPCDPPLPLSAQAPRKRDALLPPAWLDWTGSVEAMTWEGGSRLWIASSDAISRVDFASKKVVQEWNLPSAQSQPGRLRSVLADLSDGGTSKVGWFDLGRGQGRLYAKGGGESFEALQSIDGYPFTERVLRFVRAPFDAEDGLFVVQDFKGQELSRCLEVARFSGPGGTLFGLLEPEGTVKALKGSDLAVVNGPLSAQASAIGGFGGVLLTASAVPPFEVRAFRFSSRGAWEEAWSSPPLPAAATALCAGEPGGVATLIAAVPTQGGSAIYAFGLGAGTGR
jgi:hypothetical protein